MKRTSGKRKNGTDDPIEVAFILKNQRSWPTRRIASHLGVSQRTIQRWLKEYEDKESRYWKGTRGSKNRVCTYDDNVKEAVLSLRRELPSRSAVAIHRHLTAALGTNCPSLTTIRRLLREAGLTKETSGRDKDYIKFEREHPDDLWQVDFKGKDHVRHLGWLHLLAFLDDCSRFVVAARWYASEREEQVLHLLKEALEKHGLPKQILSDNGSQFKSSRGEVNTTRYYRLLTHLGVQAIYHRPHHPQSKGKLERWFGFVQSSFVPEARLFVEQNPRLTLAGFNAYFQEWLTWYNYQHEHSSLDGAPPGKVYKESPRDSPRSLDIELDWGAWLEKVETRKVDKQGQISIDGRRYQLTPGYARRKVEIRRLPGKIDVTLDETCMDTFIVPSEVKKGENTTKTRKINKDGYLKFEGRVYKLGSRDRLKTVSVGKTLEGEEILVYEGDNLIARLDVKDGKEY